MTRAAFFEPEAWERDYFRAHLPGARLKAEVLARAGNRLHVRL